MLNVVIISPGFAVDENDTLCLPFIQIYIKELIKNPNINLRIISEQYPIKDNYSWNSIQIHTLQKKSGSFFNKLLAKLKLKQCLNQLNNESQINVIHHFWLSKLTLISAKFCKQNNIKHVLTLAGQDSIQAYKFINPTIINYSRVFCMSPFHLKTLQETTKLDARIIEWGIETITPTYKERTIDLLFCGWINEVKNANQFIEIVEKLNSTAVLNKVVICGGGEGLTYLKQNIHNRGLQNLIELKGETPRNEVLNMMQQTKMLIHTSNFESFGLVLVEALACGCKVLTKPVGIAYLNKHMIACDTTDEFVNEIKTHINDNSISHFQNFSINKTINAYMEIYNH